MLPAGNRHRERDTTLSDQSALDVAAAIADPAERAAALTRVLTEYQALSNRAAGLRREAINQALGAGMTQDQLARAIGVTPGRVSQMSRAGGRADSPAPVTTGWAAEPGADQAAVRVAICGSRAAGTNAEHLAAAVPALGELLMRRRYAVSNGPVGVGAEVLTYIADQHHPAGLESVRGIIGHANVVRDADYVLIVGGGTGTQAEADAAAEAGSRLLPMPLSGGAAARVYMRQLGDTSLRGWLTDDQFSALATADAARFAEIAESVIDQGGDHA
jgi:hypothetical protein